MAETAEGGALLRRARRVERIDLDHPAVGVVAVAVVVGGRGAEDFGVPAAVLAVGGVGRDGGPEFAAGAGHAVAAEAREFLRRALAVVGSLDAAEVAGPVLFAGEVRAPRRGAVGAVVERAAGLAAVGRVLGLQVVGLGGRARELHVGERVDAAVEARILLVAPAAAGLVDLDHAHAVQVELALHFIGDGAHTAHDGLAVRVQEQGRDGFVVHHQQAARGVGRVPLVRGVDAEEGHAVVVVAGAAVIGGRIIRAVVLVRGHAGGDRVAQAVEHAGGVAGGHGHDVVEALGHGVEAQLQRRGRRGGGRCGSRCRRNDGEGCAATTAAATAGLQQCGAGGTDAQAEQMAAAQARRDQVGEGRVRGRVGADIVEIDAVGVRAGVCGHAQYLSWVGIETSPRS
ncbi:hypothetical protein D3C71_1281560 [compost metagenome]